MVEKRGLQATPSEKNGEAKTALGMTRRKAIAVSAAGVALAIPGLAVIYRWVSSRNVTGITIEGPFQRGVCNITQLPIDVSNQPDWFSVDRLIVGWSLFEPSADLTLKLYDAPDFPSTSLLQIDGRIVGRSGDTLARAMQNYDVSRIPRKRRIISLGMSTARIEPAIDHSIPWSPDLRLEDILSMRWEIHGV